MEATTTTETETLTATIADEVLHCGWCLLSIPKGKVYMETNMPGYRGRTALCLACTKETMESNARRARQ